MIASLFLALLPLFVCVPIATAVSAAPAPVSPVVDDWHQSGTATVDQADEPVLIGISCPAIWGVHNGQEFIAFINPETNGVIAFVNGTPPGLSVDVESTGPSSATATVSSGGQSITCNCESS